MNLFAGTYRKRFAAVMLVSYLLLVSLSIFHYHHVSIQEGSYKLVNDGGSNSDPFDKLVDLTHECTIQQFASTVLNFNFSSVFNIVKNIRVENISLNIIDNFHSETHFNGNPHRAPPSLV